MLAASCFRVSKWLWARRAIAGALSEDVMPVLLVVDSGPSGNGSPDPRCLSRQQPALGLRQQQGGGGQQAIGNDGKHADRLSERQHRAQHANEQRIYRRDAPAEIIGEALARAAHAGREQFGQERAHAGKHALREEAEREAEKQHHGVVNGKLRVADDRHDRANREQNEIRAAPDPIAEPRADPPADQRADDDDGEISAGSQNRKFALGTQEGRQPGGDRIVAALGARREQAGQCRRLDHGRRKNLEEVRLLAGRRKVLLGFREDRRFGDQAPHEENEDCRRQSDPEENAPGKLLREYRKQQRRDQRRDAPADRPRRLHRADRLAAMLSPDHLADQHGSRRPFPAEAEPHQSAKDEKLGIALGKAAQEGEDGEPRDGDLEHAHAPDAVRQRAGTPAAEGRREQRRRADEPGVRIGDRKSPNDRRNGETEHLNVHGIQHPAADAGPKGLPLGRTHFRIPYSRMMLAAAGDGPDRRHVRLRLIVAHTAIFTPTAFFDVEQGGDQIGPCHAVGAGAVEDVAKVGQQDHAGVFVMESAGRKLLRPRAPVKQLCCSGVLVATNRMFGLVTASQIASASAASFF